MPSVTEVLDYLTEPELLNWFRNNSKAKCAKISEEAIRVGSLVDSLVQEDIKDGGYLAPEGDEPVVQCLKGWESFKKDHPWFLSSVKYVQKELRYEDVVGHPDFILERLDGWGIVDLKCATSIRPRYWTQCAEYGWLRTQSVITTTGFIGILRLDKITSLYEYKEITKYTDIFYEIKVFDAYLTAYNHNVKNREIIRRQLEEELLNAS